MVHVAHEDARAYVAWAGAALPTEAEWEYAARGGLEGAAFTWGDEARPGGRIMANTWDGPDFPWRSTGESGWTRTSPVGSFPANGFGLPDMAGNVWEWTEDWWTEPPSRRRRLAVLRAGATRAAARSRPSYDPAQPSSASAARSSRAARTCAPTPTACATGPPPAAPRWSTPA